MWVSGINEESDDWLMFGLNIFYWNLSNVLEFLYVSFRLPVPPRTKSKSIAASGLFPNTEVIRGPHWKWKNDDGIAIYFKLLRED